MPIISNNVDHLETVIIYQSQKYDIMLQSNIEWCLGIEIQKLAYGSTLVKQLATITDMMEQYQLVDAKTTTTPRHTTYVNDLDGTSGESTLLATDEASAFKSMLGSLQYPTVSTRPDIANALSILRKPIKQTK